MRLWKGFRILRSGKEPPSWVVRYRKYVYGFSLLALLFIVLESGLRWQLPPFLSVISVATDYGVFITFLLDAILTFYFTYPKTTYFRRNWLDVLVFFPLVLSLISLRVGAGLIIVRHLVVLIQVFTRTRKFANLLRGIRLNAARVVVLSFASVILVGTILLTFPTATSDGVGTGFVNALFTATSATCVTGLIVQDTPVYFTSFGQMVILVLIQLGGLGIMAYSAFLAILLGRFTLGQRAMVQEMLEEERNVLRMVFYIFKMTFLVELLGALFLFSRWFFYFDAPVKALYYSVFHSVSAFCNAGFSLFSDSLSGFVSDPVVNGVIMGLIVLGGFGFIVVYEIVRKMKDRRSLLSTHTRLVLTMSALLTAVGFLAIFFFEFDGALLDHPLGAKVWASLFQAITPRTAGFNTILISALSPVTLCLIVILMFLGASPGSTGGGIKTTTSAILLLSLRSILRGKQNIEVFGRTIPSSIVYRAVGLLVGALLLLSSMFLLLLVFEQKPFLSLLFEAVSAFGTVGLSTGITPDLTTVGKFIIIILMFGGRIGPLTLAIAMTRRMRTGTVAYPEARVIVG